MIYRLVRLTRKVRCFFSGNKRREERWYLFTIHHKMPVEEIRQRLIPFCYQYNPFSITHRGQVWTCRRLTATVNHQIHLRFYYLDERTIVTGHYELDPTVFFREHHLGLDLRALVDNELWHIKSALLCRKPWE